MPRNRSLRRAAGTSRGRTRGKQFTFRRRPERIRERSCAAKRGTLAAKRSRSVLTVSSLGDRRMSFHFFGRAYVTFLAPEREEY